MGDPHCAVPPLAIALVDIVVLELGPMTDVFERHPTPERNKHVRVHLEIAANRLKRFLHRGNVRPCEDLVEVVEVRLDGASFLRYR